MSEPEAAAHSGDTHEQIMEATFRAVSKHGYTDLRVRDIGAEMELSRQVIHYHFDRRNRPSASGLDPEGEGRELG
ncbi:transcriptional regulator, TetR family [Halobellus clavatus]|uniref:Transcriptional regulator, TetR family n=1 Tax=Halobellus clavatus TaxID=660517 RepID=A0A1H3FWB3_9EURY|nr:transcriptional regulator, TetR family [Halobellus clavatus]